MVVAAAAQRSFFPWFEAASSGVDFGAWRSRIQCFLIRDSKLNRWRTGGGWRRLTGAELVGARGRSLGLGDKARIQDLGFGLDAALKQRSGAGCYVIIIIISFSES